MNARAVLEQLVSAAALPPVMSTRVLSGRGFDNQLLVGLLGDGHEVLLRHHIDAHAEELRREIPCLTHTDANFHNLILAADRVTLIDWDYPGVRYPLEELEALEEHAYLNGVAELPEAFFAGYGRQVSRTLLRLHRIAGCLGHLGSREWAEMAADRRHPPELRSMIRAWDERLKTWIYQIGDHLDHLAEL